MERTRREFLATAAGSLAATSLAGCVADAEGEVYAAFFPLASLSRSVVGDGVTVNDPVPVGQVGHGWSPSSELTPEVASAAAFVYLDTPEFGWAQDVAAVIEDEDHDVALVDALADVELRRADHDGHDHGDGGEEGHTEGDHEGDEHEDDEQDGDGHDGDDHDGDDHDDEGADAGDQDGDHDDHDDGSSDAAHDPHAWVDPVNAATMVETIRDGLVEALPDRADEIREGADATLAELADLDEAYASTVADAEHDAIVLASHDSFQYLAARYGFEVHTPVGISPHEEPSTQAVVETVEFVDERGIDHVLYDTFQPASWAETIVEESSASEALPISPVSTTTEEWEERGWGYVEQMREYNLPTVATALGAET